MSSQKRTHWYRMIFASGAVLVCLCSFHSDVKSDVPMLQDSECVNTFCDGWQGNCRKVGPNVLGECHICESSGLPVSKHCRQTPNKCCFAESTAFNRVGCAVRLPGHCVEDPCYYTGASCVVNDGAQPDPSDKCWLTVCDLNRVNCDMQ